MGVDGKNVVGMVGVLLIYLLIFNWCNLILELSEILCKKNLVNSFRFLVFCPNKIVDGKLNAKSLVEKKKHAVTTILKSA